MLRLSLTRLIKFSGLNGAQWGTRLLERNAVVTCRFFIIHRFPYLREYADLPGGPSMQTGYSLPAVFARNVYISPTATACTFSLNSCKLAEE